MGLERLVRAGASPTRSDPEGSSRNEPRLGRYQPLTTVALRSDATPRQSFRRNDERGRPLQLLV